MRRRPGWGGALQRPECAPLGGLPSTPWPSLTPRPGFTEPVPGPAHSSRTANGRLPNAPRLLPQRGEDGEPPGAVAPRPALMETWRLPGGGARLEQSPGTGPRLAARVSGRKLQGPYCLWCKPDLRAPAGSWLARPGVTATLHSRSPQTREATRGLDPDRRAALDRGPPSREQMPGAFTGVT